MKELVTRYEIRDPQGEIVAVHVRYDRTDGSKSFAWEGADGSKGLNGLPVSKLPLFGSERVAGWDRGEPIIIVEGEKTAEALKQHGFNALATVTGASSCPDLEALGVLRGHPVILWPDADERGRRHMWNLAESLRWIAASVRVFEWDGAPPHGDAADYFGSGTADGLRAELLASKPASDWTATDESPPAISGFVDEAFGSLPDPPGRDDYVMAIRKLRAKCVDLTELELAAIQHEAIARLNSMGVSSREAQDLVRAGLKRRVDTKSKEALQGTAVDLGDPDPWPDAVDGAALADEIAAQLLRYVVLPLEAAWAVVLWIFFTHLLDVVPVAPRLLITSATKACGKTKLLTLLTVLARRALSGSSVTQAAV